MTEQWYWKHKGSLLGPLSTEELADLVRHHRVLNQDEIRLEGEQEWMSGTDVKTLFENSQGSSAAQAASTLLSQAGHQRRTGHGGAGQRHGWQFGIGLQLIAQVLGGLIDSSLSLLASVAMRLKGLANRWVTVVVITAIAVSLFLKGSDFTGSENRRIFAETNDLMNRMQVVSRSPQEWEQFRNESQAWLKETRQSLLDTSKRLEGGRTTRFAWEQENKDARKCLIQTLNALIAALDRGPLVKEEFVQIATASLSGAERVLNGTVRLEQQAFRQRMAQTKAAKEGPTTTPREKFAMAGVVAVDVFLVIGGIVYWLRQRRARPA